MSKVVMILRTIGKNKLLRNSVFIGSIFSASEFTQETILGYEKYDWAKIGRFAVFGFFCNGPFNYTWFRFLDKIMPGNAGRTAVTKVVFDQLFAAPIIAGGFFVVMDILERKEDILHDAKQKTLPSWLAGLAFWPPAQLVNFKFVSPQFRVAYVGIVAYIWTNFLCYMRRKDIHFTIGSSK
ncbi:mpv17-like protein [Saccoglossus kowalevskii]|uniref:Mitochondrial inner membrane protein Mpv17 n=1 Tax=Saccoglossus kowalevskii TaxID=10224 RepID=A0ABM0GJ47_SACKO|nr:PREDICTED: mpv17-like protein-like [Saccoglossus kowalevskii]